MFRDIPLRHCNGNVVVNELAVVRLHDRSTPVTLKMFVDSNYAKRPGREALDSEWEAPTKLRAAQAALFSFQAVLRALWPLDTTPETIGHILVKADWGGAQRSDAARAALVEQLFNRVMVENANLAVRRLAPADYRRVKEIWEDILELQPKAAAHLGQHMEPALGGAAAKGNRGGRGGAVRSGGAGPTARVGNVFVCHAYNEQQGCKRDKHRQGCKNAMGQVFAHNCSFRKKDGEFCLAAHEKFNHK